MHRFYFYHTIKQNYGDRNTQHRNNSAIHLLPQHMNAYWHAANYLSVGHMYLYEKPLLNKPFKRIIGMQM
ncbi:hypothetical protein FC093_23250 [Ilyomonas limi]|uniref:Xylulose 5-phosphate/Fructose 6-phosphate phosphoketolase N-terminal domain-containing protein n=1 Tax=Ilyomonas limi TaxID=2575867 RepID=A0A4U3KPN6_9BACT|nr:hypothetical protein FC093_23250 [Ilyomonas limi]